MLVDLKCGICILLPHFSLYVSGFYQVLLEMSGSLTNIWHQLGRSKAEPGIIWRLTHLVVDAGCWLRPELGLLSRTFPFGSPCGLGFLITWCLGSRGELSESANEGCVTFYDLHLKVTQYHSHCILFSETEEHVQEKPVKTEWKEVYFHIRF